MARAADAARAHRAPPGARGRRERIAEIQDPAWADFVRDGRSASSLEILSRGVRPARAVLGHHASSTRPSLARPSTPLDAFPRVRSMSAPILAPRAAPPAPRSSPPRAPGRPRRAGARRARGPAPPDATGPLPLPLRRHRLIIRPRPLRGSFIPGFLARVAECNEITPEDIATYVPLRVAGVSVGLLTPDRRRPLSRRGGVFEKATVARGPPPPPPPPPRASSSISTPPADCPRTNARA